MKIFLLSNQPDRTTRLQLFGKTLAGLGHEVIVPRFTSTNWLTVAHEAKQQIKKIKPDIVQIFNVPDVIYKGIPNLKGKYFQKLFYDYRSPWGIELSEYVGWFGKAFGEHHERHLIKNADRITTVNSPLAHKLLGYKKNDSPVIIPNYPEKEFSDKCLIKTDEKISVLFIGRLSKLEGAHHLPEIAKAIWESTKPTPMYVVGDGPLDLDMIDPVTVFNPTRSLLDVPWLPHNKLPEIISGSKVCVIPRDETALTPYATDKSVWKVNEFLNAGKIVVASGITVEEPRKNLYIVKPEEIIDEIIKRLQTPPLPLSLSDYHYWEDNKELIKAVYE